MSSSRLSVSGGPLFLRGTFFLSLVQKLMAESSLFRADLAEDISAVKRQHIATCRALLALSILMIFLFWGAYQITDLGVKDPLWGRALFACVPASGLALSYLSQVAQRHFISLWRGFLYLTIVWFTGLSALNQFAPAYSLGLFFVVAATSAAFGVGLRREGPFLPFLGVSVLLPGGAAVLTSTWGGAEVPTLPILLVGLVSLAAIFYLILGWRVEIEEALQKRREEAGAASRLKSTIIDNMSHELRTPLTSILGFAEALEDELSGPTEEMASSIHKSGRRLKQTLEVLLDLSHLESGYVEAGKAGFEPEWIEVGARVREITRNFSSQAKEKGIDLEVRVSTGRKESTLESTAPETRSKTDLEGSAKAYLNPDLFDRITTALLDNAVKFTDEGHIIVSTDVREEQVLLIVEDSGIGMEKPEKLFEPFRQGSEGIDRKHEGLGLGLALIGQIVEILGGSIELESEPGEGTQAQVRLPRFSRKPISQKRENQKT